MTFLAHSENSAGQGHLLPDHLRAVAELCRNFSAEFGAGEAGYWTGLWHDLGKFASDFQGHLMALIGRQGPDHSTAGALMASSSCEPLAFPVAGHHSGLPDLETLKNRLSTKGPALQSAIDLASAQLGQVQPSGPKVRYLPDYLCGGQSQPTQLEFFLRMLFSALVDADFLDTEAHFESDKAGRRGGWQSTNALWSRLEAAQDRLSGRKADTLNQIRHEVYQDCVQAASMPPGVFCLTVPTGGGKTRSAMAFALRHALAHGLRRVIMTIPYTSIIEQTADVYRDIFGNDAVLEHHSAVNWEQDDPTHERARLASENWDAPIVVTTTVQLFESLFANRPSRCRKLHNIAGSVVILDEVQALPLGLLEPVLDVLQALADHYRVTVVLCSATPPAFFTGTYLKGLREVSEIVPEPERHFEALRRVRYELPAPGQQQSWAEVAQEIRSDNHCLAVVNTKGDALALLDALGDPNAMHLSTSLCGAHRRDVLREIHRRLRAGEPCRLISTQVVEAGVDLDFPVVLRAMGPLDSIVQAAGRCNREALLKEGRVVVFVPSEGRTPVGSYRSATETTLALLAQDTVDLHDPGLFRTYFQRLFQTVDLDQKGIQALRSSFNFPEVSRCFRMIEDDTVPVGVSYKGRGKGVGSLLQAARDPAVPLRWLMRRLQPYIVNVRRRHLSRLERENLVVELIPGVWEWKGAYDPVRGISLERLPTEELVV